ncbi:MAG: hypothetical protein COV91_03785 [Candidatus Taylorbacteria bacterium CG11_big_fil_rev_8_21_14_0_20_46_11]|uniref:Uncharacterized protein n=1 Tax=Candidatus Taylorbacteria bacterium CG11_big_fil_rev_8_21_14_0_20_46_11 TaxID=1975025 RepID=A0A2H0KBC0_9BACT|nr:MAG: hypothetical protein COV91_03785 [Candidatus Taylorbacteria bacterium CG11_big_fil_rev_8_21_14_0_20_46_11]
MARIIKLTQALKRQPDDLNGLLKKAVVLRKKLPDMEGTFVVKNLKALLSAKISDVLLKKDMIDSACFLCGIHIAQLLSDLTVTAPESWYAIDYILKSNQRGDPSALKQGANVCFLICAVFKERGEHRAMTYRDYESMGMGLYFQFYSQTGKEIGYHMGRQYRLMVRVTNECLKTL